MQRAVIFDSLKALSFSAKQMSKSAQSDNYLSAYLAGYEDALIACALVLGVSDEMKVYLREGDR